MKGLKIMMIEGFSIFAIVGVCTVLLACGILFYYILGKA